jgi:hypothetical protein
MTVDNQILAFAGCILMLFMSCVAWSLPDSDAPEADYFALFWMSLTGLAMFAILAAGGITP